MNHKLFWINEIFLITKKKEGYSEESWYNDVFDFLYELDIKDLKKKYINYARKYSKQ